MPARLRVQETRPLTGVAAQTAFGRDRLASAPRCARVGPGVPPPGWAQLLFQPRGRPRSWVIRGGGLSQPLHSPC